MGIDDLGLYGAIVRGGVQQVAGGLATAINLELERTDTRSSSTKAEPSPDLKALVPDLEELCAVYCYERHLRDGARFNTQEIVCLMLSQNAVYFVLGIKAEPGKAVIIQNLFPKDGSKDSPFDLPKLLEIAGYEVDRYMKAAQKV